MEPCFRKINLASLRVQSEQRKIGSHGQLKRTAPVCGKRDCKLGQSGGNEKNLKGCYR